MVIERSSTDKKIFKVFSIIESLIKKFTCLGNPFYKCIIMLCNFE